MENINNVDKVQNEIQKALQKQKEIYKIPDFPPLSTEELLEILGQTIKKDETNKIITFLCQLSAFTESAQFNISFNAPSSTGKTYLPLEVASFFPEEDVKAIGYCSPTAFFHDKYEYDKEQDVLVVDLSRKILIFLDQPHTLLLQHLRPLFSHDKKEIKIKITDRGKGVGHRTKNVLIIGYPSAIFCSAGLRLDEQEATRFFLLSPEISQEKIRQAIFEKLRRETDSEAYKRSLDDNPKREALKNRIRVIKAANIDNVKIDSVEKIKEAFLKQSRILKPRDTRDVGRLMSLVKSLALLNFWHRKKEMGLAGLSIVANDEDIEGGLKLWDDISQSQGHNLPPYIYNLFKEVILPAYETAQKGLTRRDIIRKHYEICERAIPDWQLRREILPMLEMAGLVIQEPNPDNKRVMLVYPAEYKNIGDSTVYTPRKPKTSVDTQPSLLY